MSEEWKLQLSVKVGQDMVNVRANSPAELGMYLDNLPHEEIANARAALGAINAVASVVAAVAPAVAGGGSNVVPITSAPVQQAAVGGVESASDNWDNHYTRGLPNAPACAHGPMLKANKKAKSGKRYDAWVCAGPDQGFPPRVKAADACALQFIDS